MNKPSLLDIVSVEKDSSLDIEQIDLMLVRSKIQDLFCEYFLNQGFTLEEPAPLISKDDASVIFTGSSTNVFKKYILEENPIEEQGVILYQDKIRTHNYHTFFNEEIIEFVGKFRGGGVLSQYSNYDLVAKSVVDFMSCRIGVEPEDLSIDLSSLDRIQVECWESISSNLGVSVFVDRMYPDYYKWTFGNPRLEGVGAMLSIRDRSGQFNEFSSLESIVVDGIPEFVEWGFGEEVLAVRLFSSDHPLLATTLRDSEIDFFESQKHIKLGDILYTLLSILNEGVWLSSNTPKKAKTVLKRYLQGLVYFIRELNVSISDLREVLIFVNSHEFQVSDEMINLLIKYLEEKNRRQVLFETALLSAIKGDTREFVKLSGVRKQLRSTNMINISELSKKYSFYGLTTSSFFSDVRNYLIFENGHYYYNFT